MNDINVRVVETGKDLGPAEVVEAKDNEKDPLAIDDDAKPSNEVKVDKAPVKPAVCDENAKEENDTQNHNGDANSTVAKPLEKKAEEKSEVETKPTSTQEETVSVTKIEPSSDVETTKTKPHLVSETKVAEKPATEAGKQTEPLVKDKSQTPPLPEVKAPSPKETVKEVSKDLSLVQAEIKTKTVEVTSVEMKAAEAKVADVEMTDVSKVDTQTFVETVKAKQPEKIGPKEVKPAMQPINGDVAKVNLKLSIDLETVETETISHSGCNATAPEPKSISTDYLMVSPTATTNIPLQEEQANKRRASDDVDTESPLKKLCQEVEKTFPQHDSMINEYIQTATKNSVDEIQRHTEQLLAEIQTLRELAQKKEHEWNNILHLKKVKEEILLRLLRRKQVFSFEKSAEVNGSDRTDPFDYLNQAKNLAIDKSDEISGLALKQPGSSMSPMIQPPVMPVTSHFNPMSGLPPPYDKAAHMQAMGKPPVFPQQIMMPGPLPGYPRDMNMNGQLPGSFGMPMGRQGPTKDVKSIIADYRQRNPDITPRRGRRMKSILNPNMMNAPRPIAPKMESMGGMNSLSSLNMLFNNLDMNQKAMLERLQQMQAGNIPNSLFKDALVQYASMQQANAMMPQRPPETVTNSRQECRPEEPPSSRHHAKEKRRPPPSEEPRDRASPRLPPPPPYPEISLLPVTQSQDQSAHNSLLHGILTKASAPDSCAPTLAKLLTSPESRLPATLPSFGQAKNCGEITITPVQPTPPPAEAPAEKTEDVVQLDDEESPTSEGSAGSPLGSGSGSGCGRLVIDEAGGEESAPLCQGCRRKDAQFVCAGCANQWYCSRDCQVAAWDEHSDMCSG